MLNMLSGLMTSRKWWGGLIILCLALQGVALYYQYQLNYLPCVLCVHLRMLVGLLLVVSCIGWIAADNRGISLIIMTAVTAIWLWLVERSYQLLATERGWNMSECSMDSGLPAWLALEKWFPWLFHIHEPCGYTPYLLFKISMAEALIVMSVFFSLLCVSILILQLKPRGSAFS